MTRFARAKGSKSSNERVPEAATPWSEMKQQLIEKKHEDENRQKRDEINARKVYIYKEFLAEKEKNDGKETKWADFPGVQKSENNSKLKKKKIKDKMLLGLKVLSESKDTEKLSKKIKNKKQKIDNEEVNIEEEEDFNIDEVGSDNEIDEQFNDLKMKLDKILEAEHSDNEEHIKSSGNSMEISDSDVPEEVSSKEEMPEIKIKKLKKKKTKLEVPLELKQSELKMTENIDKDIKKQKKKKIKLQVPSEIEKENENVNNVKKQKKEKIKSQVSSDIEKGELQMKSENTSKDVKKHKKKLVKQLSENIQNGGYEKITKEIKTSMNSNKDRIVDTEKTGKKKEKQNPSTAQKNSNQTPKDLKRKSEDLDEASKAKIARKQRKHERQFERRKLKRAQKAAEREAQAQNEKKIHECTDNNNKEYNIPKQNQITTSNSEQQPSKKKAKNNNVELKDDSSKNNQEKREKKKKVDKTRRKPVNEERVVINGQTIDLEFFEGFPIKKDDAERLKKLRKQMISKGLPRSEINAALKLERRRAEKALNRLKKVVCFNCRKSGHNLSECPQINSGQLAETTAIDICFKCGSTEHRSFECKVVRGDSFKFATCFICKEQGHLSKQCPDNPRGMYPKGGACKVCGDVTHLKRDCPQYQAQQQDQDGTKIEVMDNNNPDDIGDNRDKKVNIGAKPLNKIIKF